MAHSAGADLNKPSIMPPQNTDTARLTKEKAPREELWKYPWRGEELASQQDSKPAHTATGLDIAINNPGPVSAGQIIVVRSKRKFSNGSLSERACPAAIFGCPIRERRPKPSGPLWPHSSILL